MERANLSPINHFDDLYNRLYRSANQSKTEAEILTAESLNLAIENARNVFTDDIDLTAEKTTSPAHEIIEKLKTMLDKYIKREELDKLRSEAQELVNNLQYRYYQTRVTSFTPFLVIDDATTTKHVSLEIFKGYFCNGSEAKLTISDRSCRLVKSKSDKSSLTFHVPQDIRSRTAHFSLLEAKLEVEAKESIFSAEKIQSNYKLMLAVLPRIAGRASVTYVTEEEVRMDEKKISENRSFDGTKSPDKVVSFKYSITPDEGYSIDTTKQPTLIRTDARGPHTEEILSVSADKIDVKVKLNKGEKTGKVTVAVEFEQFKMVSNTKERKKDYKLNWKDPIDFKPESKEKIKVSFTDYNKVTQEYTKSSLDNKHILQIQEENGAWKIWAERPKDLAALSELAPVEEKEISTTPSEPVSDAPVNNYSQDLMQKFYDLLSALSWKSSPLLEDAEKLKEELEKSMISPDDAKGKVEDLLHRSQIG